MSKLEELIQQYCSDGVVCKKLKDVSVMQRGTSMTKAQATDGDIPVISGGREPAFFCDQFNREGETITVAGSGAGAGYVQYWDKPIFANDCFTIAGKEGVSTKYLYYCLANQQQKIYDTKKGGGVPHVHISDIDMFEVPLPAMPVQREIVRILDEFSLLSAELAAELAARKKQYNYYLNSLLDISKLNANEIKYVGDLFEIKNGLNKEKEAFGKGTPIVNFTDVFNKRYLTSDMLKGKVTLSDSEIERYKVQKGDVFFTRTSETKEEVGMSSTVIEDIPECTFSGFVLRARPLTDLLLPKFCAYYFSTNQVRNNIVRYASFTTRATTSGPKLSKIPVPIISKEKQQWIVDILDRFDSLCGSISEGIPAEIEARQKQYEYYRDKLLSFKRIDV